MEGELEGAGFSEGDHLPLPKGWVKSYTEDGLVYYKDTITKTTHWELPEALIKVNQFNERTVCLDGEFYKVFTLDELQKVIAKDTKNSQYLPETAIVFAVLFFIGIAVIVVGLVTEIQLLAITGGIVAGLCAIAVMYYACNKGLTASEKNQYYAREYRDALEFDIYEKRINKITFNVDYGFDFAAETQKEKERNLCEAEIEINDNKEFICKFEDLVQFGFGRVHQGSNQYLFYIIMEYLKNDEILSWKGNKLSESKHSRIWNKLKYVVENSDDSQLKLAGFNEKAIK